METNPGTKVIEKSEVLGHFAVWYDTTAINNLFGLLEVVDKGQKVTFGSRKYNSFKVNTTHGRLIKFNVNDRDLCIKEETSPHDCQVFSQELIYVFTPIEMS